VGKVLLVVCKVLLNRAWLVRVLQVVKVVKHLLVLRVDRLVVKVVYRVKRCPIHGQLRRTDPPMISC
jgi:hypothetical protein